MNPTQTQDERENALRHKISFLSEYFPSIALSDVETIATMAFNTGMIQGYQECLREINKIGKQHT